VDVPVEYVGNADNPARPERAGEFRRNCGCRLNLGVGETLAAEYSEIEKKERGTSRRKERKGTSAIPFGTIIATRGCVSQDGLPTRSGLDVEWIGRGCAQH
jgi:hypothetical protein